MKHGRARQGLVKLGLADQQLLLQWADSVGARSELPRLIRRLILETGRGVVQLGFPAGEGIATRSWDGTVRATEATAFIPKGLSLWELSVEKSVGIKADRDFEKRSDTPDGSPTSSCTYVAVSLRRWRDRGRWAREWAAMGRWAEVRAYGVDDIETWLEVAPVTHAWISEELGLGPYGLRAAESWWSSWSAATTPPLTEALVLAGRSAAVEDLSKRFAGHPQITTVKGDSTDQIVAFLSAAGHQASIAGDARLLTRTAIVDDVGTWRALLGHGSELVLVPVSEVVIAEAAASRLHHVVIPVTGAVDADIELPPIEVSEAVAALRAAGIDDFRQADELGRLARRGVLALRRRLANKPELHVPMWARRPVSRTLRGILLAGRWHDKYDSDRAVLAALAGTAYDQLQETLMSLAALEDPFIAAVDGAWGLVSPFDAWLLLRTQLDEDDLRRLEAAVRDVLGELDPALELEPEQRWLAALQGRVRSFSADLRQGLAQTLALLGVHGERIGTSSGSTGSNWAAYAVRELLRKANDDASCRVWVSLADLLQLLSEAGPDAFLDAVRQGVTGDTPVLAGMFTDREDSGLFGAHSPHTHLLWALENTAWSPDHFGQTVDLLARLAEIDPGGQLSNRPFATLANIFCPSFPGTSVDASRRLAALDGLRRRHGDVAWRLMLAVLDLPETILPTSEPRFRDWKPACVPVKIVEYLNWARAVVERLLDDAHTPERWVSLIKKLSQLPPDERKSVRDTLLARHGAGSLAAIDTAPPWEALRALVATHRAFADAAWALPEEELQDLEKLEAAMAPAQPTIRHAWLFAEHMPDLGDRELRDDFSRYDTALAQRRRDAVSEILQAGGLAEIRLLAQHALLPWSVGVALADAHADETDTTLIELIDSGTEAEVELALAYVARRFTRDGWGWIDRLLAQPALSAHQRARVILATRDFPTAWELAERFGSAASEQFWKYFQPHGLGFDFAHVELAAQRLLHARRYAAVLRLLRLYRRQRTPQVSEAEIIAQALEAALVNEPVDPELQALAEHDFKAAFEILDEHSESIGWERIARLQWAFLPAFGVKPKIDVLHRLLAADPEFFVQVLSSVYRPRSSDERADESDAATRTAVNARRLLSSWSTLPGLTDSGAIDGKTLREWIRDTLAKLDAADRREVGETHIGHILAWAPADTDGRWPPAEVRDLLEELQSGRIERGLATEMFNKRGVTTRSPEEGGVQERELVERYRREAEQFADEWPRSAAVLRSLATSYEHHARREEGTAERVRRGYDV